ncbi:hypothetical protein JCM15519_13250 [Fundidesulfovibrio butyratiphilus]
MNSPADFPLDSRPQPADESVEDRARRVAEIKKLVQSGKYRADSREILFNMMKTAT